MEIEVDQGKLAKALNAVSRVAAGARATLPVLNNVLIRVDGKKATLTTTNLDMAMVDYLPTSNVKNGVVTVPAKLLAEFVGNLPGGTVKIMASGDKVTTTLGSYRSVMNGTPADDFPELPPIDEKKVVKYKMSVEEFRAGLAQVMIASSHDMTRPALTGIYFNTYDGDLYVAGTDGYRMAERKLIEKVKSEVSAIVPSNSLAEVMRSLSDEMEEIEFLFDETQVRFRLGEIEITSNLIDSSYPEYRQLLPKKSEVTVVVSRAELTRVTKLAALFARHTGRVIRCEAKASGKLSMASIANEYGENASEIDAKCSRDGKTMLDAKYLLDAIGVLEEDEVELGFAASGASPVGIKNAKSNNYVHMIMPMNQ